MVTLKSSCVHNAIEPERPGEGRLGADLNIGHPTHAPSDAVSPETAAQALKTWLSEGLADLEAGRAIDVEPAGLRQLINQHKGG